MEKLKMQTADGVQDNIGKIAELFPECITECKETLMGGVKRAIDFDKLRQLLSSEIVEGREERYQFTWPDKRKAILAANAPVNATLRPCREESVNFDTTQNLYIEGNNLDVLKCLKETYLHKVKMIYIDPPYNTGKDFVYKDNRRTENLEFRAKSGNYDEDDNLLVNRMVLNTESNGRFHTDWLNMIYPSLKVARDLLTENGVIFISIDDNEVENLRKVCDEIFGESNFIANLIWKSKSGGANDSRFFAVDHEYVIVYAKSVNKFVLGLDKEASVTTSYNRKDEKGAYALDRLDKQSIRYSESLDYEILGPDGTSYRPKHKDPAHPNATWRWSKKKVEENKADLVFENGCVYTKNYQKEGAIARSLLLDDRFGRTRTGKTDCFALLERDVFSNPKPVKLIRYLQIIATDKDSLILDFFSGSATTAHAVMQLNAEDGGKRKFIMVQLPELTDEKSEAYKAGYKTICEIGKERIRRAGAKIKADSPLTTQDLDTGFRVLKLGSTNMEDIYYSPAATDQRNLSNMVYNVKPDRTSEDLLFQVMLELGAELNSSIRTKELTNEELGMRNEELGRRKYTIYNVADGYIVACFDQDVTDEVVTAIAKMQPMYAVLRDTSMKTDSTATNFEQIFKTFAPNCVCRII